MDTNIQNFSFSKKYISGELHHGFWKIVTKGLGFFNTFFIISSLTVYQYGVFHLLLATYGIASALTTLGNGTINNDILRFIGEGKESHAKRLFFEYNTVRILVAMLLGLAFFFGSELLSFRYKPDFISIIKVLSLLLFFQTLASMAKSVLRTRLNFFAVASFNAVNKIVQAGVLVYFFIFSSITTYEAILSMVIASGLSLLIMISPLLHAYKPWKGRHVHENVIITRIFSKYGKWEVYKQFTSRITSSLQLLLIKLFISTEAVGIYNIALMLVDFFKTFMFTNTLITIIPRALNSAKRVSHVFIYGVKYLSIISIFVLIMGILAGPIVVYTFFEQYIEAIPFFLFLMFSIIVYPVAVITGVFLNVYRKQKFIFGISVLRHIITIILLAILLPIIGLWGAVAAKLITLVIISYISYRYLVSREPSLRIHRTALFSFDEKDRSVLTLIWSNFRSLIAIKSRSLLKAMHIR